MGRDQRLEESAQKYELATARRMDLHVVMIGVVLPGLKIKQ